MGEHSSPLKSQFICCHNYGVLLFINCLQYFLILYSLYLSENMACLFVLIFMYLFIYWISTYFLFYDILLLVILFSFLFYFILNLWLKLKCVTSLASLVSEMQISHFKLIFWDTPPVSHWSDSSPALNSRHWLNHYCCVVLVAVLYFAGLNNKTAYSSLKYYMTLMKSQRFNMILRTHRSGAFMWTECMKV